MTLTVSQQQTESLRRVLSAPLAERYERIVHERTTHYLQGLSIGLILAFLIVGSSGISNI
jgi:hypothetical protein